MEKIKSMPTKIGRTWLEVGYGDQVVRFAYPAFKGTHQECFEAIGKDKELRPAEGVELALLAHEAYAGKDEQWKDVKQTCFQSNYTRAPNRTFWLPKGLIKGDKSLCGVLVEKDLKRKGLSTKMEVPVDLSGWKEQNGLYVKDDSTFVPVDKYNLGEMKENDRFTRAVLGNEGVPIFIKTAKDEKLTPYNWGINVNDISEPVQRVALLYEYCGGLILGGGSGWGGGAGGRAFGVSAADEASTGKKI